MDTAWPFLGRDREQAAIDEAFARTGSGGVVLVGEPGVGRTRLARETLGRFRAAGRHAEWVAAGLALDSVPFSAVAELMPSQVSPDAHPTRVLRAVADRFATLGGRPGALVVVDDAHRLDPHSAMLVAHLAARSLAFVVLTVQCGQPAPDPVGMLWKDGIASRIEVPPLPAGAIDELIRRTLGGPVDAITGHRLRITALGRPGVLRELLACAIDDGDLRERFGIWRWHAPAASSRRVADLVAAQLAHCSPEVRAVLEVVACGEPLSLALVAHFAQPPAIEAAERSGLLVMERDGARIQARLASPLYGTAIRRTVPVLRTRELAARLAEVLAAGPLRRADDPVRLAAWQREAGVVIVPELLLPAARRVMSRDPGLAEWCARAAIGAGVGGEAQLVLVQVLAGQGRRDETAALLADVVPAAGQRAEWSAAQAVAYYWGAGRIEQARAAIDRAAPVLGATLADALRAWLLVFGGAYREALAAARDVLARPACDDYPAVWAAAAGCAAAGLIGLADETARLRRRALAAVDALPDPDSARPYVACITGSALLSCGDLTAAAAIADRGYTAAAAAQAPLPLGLWALFRGMAARAAGRVVTAQGLLREAAALLSETATRLVPLCLAELAGAAALAGDGAAAAAWLERLGPPSAAGPAVLPWRERAAAWVLAGRGSTTEAVERLCAAATSASPMAEVHLLYDVARLGAAARVRDRLTQLAEELRGPLAPVLADAAGGLAAGLDADEHTAAQLAGAGHTLADLGYRLLAAELMTTAARIYRRLGHRSPAAVCREVAAELAEGCEGARTVLLALGDGNALLTAREREILLLAATCSSKAIAARLGLALSTVNNHLASAYAKLGISGRGELVELLRQRAGSRE